MAPPNPIQFLTHTYHAIVDGLENTFVKPAKLCTQKLVELAKNDFYKTEKVDGGVLFNPKGLLGLFCDTEKIRLEAMGANLIQQLSITSNLLSQILTEQQLKEAKGPWAEVIQAWAGERKTEIEELAKLAGIKIPTNEAEAPSFQEKLKGLNAEFEGLGTEAQALQEKAMTPNEEGTAEGFTEAEGGRLEDIQRRFESPEGLLLQALAKQGMIEQFLTENQQHLSDAVLADISKWLEEFRKQYPQVKVELAAALQAAEAAVAKFESEPSDDSDRQVLFEGLMQAIAAENYPLSQELQATDGAVLTEADMTALAEIIQTHPLPIGKGILEKFGEWIAALENLDANPELKTSLADINRKLEAQEDLTPEEQSTAGQIAAVVGDPVMQAIYTVYVFEKQRVQQLKALNVDDPSTFQLQQIALLKFTDFKGRPTPKNLFELGKSAAALNLNLTDPAIR
ncbi:MAG: hypothetical protein HYU97_05440 [Deltaproteobacteria bacterium]|nr:hypothetical protein [Deltaproteobacteria bacterium]